MVKNEILLGDCLEVLKQLPESSINCCVTSPPYYGLRDYGTGEWVGGDENCKHVPIYDDEGRPVAECPLCGAKRVDNQIGIEETPEEYISKLTQVFEEVRRILTPDGTLWVNIGDSYAHNTKEVVSQSIEKSKDRQPHYGTRIPSGCKFKDMIGIPWMLAFSLRNAGWYLRQDIIWAKPNPMPESVKDRCTKSHEYIFLLTKSSKYYFDADAIKEPITSSVKPRVFGAKNQIGTLRGDIGNVYNPTGIKFGGNKYGDNQNPRYQIYSGKEYVETGIRNKRDVWTISPSHYNGAHFATYPEELVQTCILAGCPKGGIVLDPFMGSGTTGAVAKRNNRDYLGVELNPEYKELADNRIKNTMKRLF